MLHRRRKAQQQGTMMTETSDVQAVITLAESYYQAMVSGDAARLRGLFDARAPISGHFEGRFLWQTLEDFITEAVGLAGQHGPERCRIESLRIDGDIACVAVGGQYAQLWLIDHLLLVRVDVGWKIAAKTFHVAS
jgi:Putative lumazine-binding